MIYIYTHTTPGYAFSPRIVIWSVLCHDVNEKVYTGSSSIHPAFLLPSSEQQLEMRLSEVMVTTYCCYYYILYQHLVISAGSSYVSSCKSRLWSVWKEEQEEDEHQSESAMQYRYHPTLNSLLRRLLLLFQISNTLEHTFWRRTFSSRCDGGPASSWFAIFWILGTSTLYIHPSIHSFIPTSSLLLLYIALCASLLFLQTTLSSAIKSAINATQTLIQVIH